MTTPTDAASTDVLTVKEAANTLKVSKQLVYKEIHAGRLKSFCIGDRRLISRQDLSQYILDQKQQEVARA